ncbi:hypothetical protein TNCV_4830521 [Trichonephila clavipes]|nr:hypothetical protein TNCV_4830521 [Trichonephila clavipes]
MKPIYSSVKFKNYEVHRQKPSYCLTSDTNITLTQYGILPMCDSYTTLCLIEDSKEKSEIPLKRQSLQCLFGDSEEEARTDLPINRLTEKYPLLSSVYSEVWAKAITKALHSS